MTNYIGSRDKIADKPTSTELQTAIGSGVSPISYDATDAEWMVRPITTHSLDSAGGPDRRLLDAQNVHATYIVARDLRSSLWQQFSGSKISDDVAEGEDPPPQGVTEIRDIKSFTISRLRTWQNLGVIDKASLDTAIETGTLVIQVNPSDATQVDMNVPFEIVQPLAKLGVVAQRIPS
jgi:phage tail sheath gpL-like